MTGLNAFQIRCEEALIELLEFRGVRIGLREIVSNGESFVHCDVDGRDLEFWIYEDEAEFRVGRKRRNFEAAVFRNEDDRITSFVREVQSALDVK